VFNLPVPLATPAPQEPSSPAAPASQPRSAVSAPRLLPSCRPPARLPAGLPQKPVLRGPALTALLPCCLHPSHNPRRAVPILQPPAANGQSCEPQAPVCVPATSCTNNLRCGVQASGRARCAARGLCSAAVSTSGAAHTSARALLTRRSPPHTYRTTAAVGPSTAAPASLMSFARRACASPSRPSSRRAPPTSRCCAPATCAAASTTAGARPWRACHGVPVHAGGQSRPRGRVATAACERSRPPPSPLPPCATTPAAAAQSAAARARQATSAPRTCPRASRRSRRARRCKSAQSSAARRPTAAAAC
jgi:hypothetical protein